MSEHVPVRFDTLPEWNHRNWMNFDLLPGQEIPEEFIRTLPPCIGKANPHSNINRLQVRSEVSVAMFKARKGRNQWKGKKHTHGEVRACMYVLNGYNLVLPRIWADPVRYIRLRRGEDEIRDLEGNVIYTRVRGKREVQGVKNPDVFKMPKYPVDFPPIKPRELPTMEEKRLRVLRFLELYAREGYMSPAAAAVSVSLPMLLMWANETKELQLAVAMAEAAVKQQMRDIATGQALSGDKTMLLYFLKKEDAERAKRQEGKRFVPEMSDEVQEVIAITQRARESARVLGIQFREELPEDAQKPPSQKAVEGDGKGEGKEPGEEQAGSGVAGEAAEADHGLSTKKELTRMPAPDLPSPGDLFGQFMHAGVLGETGEEPEPPTWDDEPDTAPKPPSVNILELLGEKK